MNKAEKQILKQIIDDLLSLNCNSKVNTKDNLYYLRLCEGNLKDLLHDKYKGMKEDKGIDNQGEYLEIEY